MCCNYPCLIALYTSVGKCVNFHASAVPHLSSFRESKIKETIKVLVLALIKINSFLRYKR
jgi:hypothetical protein